MVIFSTVRAASRLSPRMIGYHLKRAARNQLALRFPGAYARHVERAAAGLPALAIEGAPTGLAERVAAFYQAEYLDRIDDAARGRFSFFGHDVDFGGPDRIDWAHKLAVEKDLHLWRMKLAHMGFCCPMLTRGGPPHHAALAQMMAGLRKRPAFDRPGCFSSYWFPYSVSHRILSLLGGYLIARHEGRLAPELYAQIEAFLRWNAGFVLANIEHELKNNHVERNLAALCFYLGHVRSVPAALARRLDRAVQGIIEACILPDGLMAERSAMYQGLSVMALQIFANTAFLQPRTRAQAAERLERAQRAWAVMSHPDGRIALFNDSWFDEVPEAGAIMKPPALGPVEILRDAGYARLSEGAFFALMDAGPIGPRWNPGHGHADFLSVEVDLERERFIVDPGTFQYSTGPRRAYDRAMQSHNGPACDGLEPVEYYDCFRVGRMVAARLTQVDKGSGGGVTGELVLPQGRLRRMVRLMPGGAGIEVRDKWSQDMEGGAVRLLIPAEWELLAHDGQQARFRHGRAEGPPIAAVIRIEAGRIESCGSGDWSCHYLESRKAHSLTLRPEAGTRLFWSIRSD